MKLEINDKGKIELDMYDIITEVVGNTPDDELWKLVEMLGWQDRIFKMVSEALAEEFSRDNYNTHIHEARDLFLKHIKQEELKFYASAISNVFDDARRHSNSFWKLYHWCQDAGVFQKFPNHPSWGELPERYNSDIRTVITQTCEAAFLKKFPELKEVS